MSDEIPKVELTLGPLARDLSFATRALRAHLRGHNERVFEEHDVPSGGIAVISLIGLNPGVSQKDLAGAVVLKKSALTKLVNELESTGLIERRKGDGDRRYNAVHLTAEGQKLYDEVMPDITAMQDALLAPLSPAERELYFDLTWRLISHLDQRTA
ncbi:MAG: winged helix-turn-helix transcriptional regulator [Vannielia sp.]|uniref:MarR family winged helix-turn-helix transcriptional regulator n=1 Tax=Rhodobacterales TaxID=204455 RepID=UPI002096094C|nr:MarR family winged helix-turn-helix transcriptional regulator [Oceanicola sp. 502str15]MCO6381568.1 MarR family transcriptional regulator [Oceanicola sp. 502str15]